MLRRFVFDSGMIGLEDFVFDSLEFASNDLELIDFLIEVFLDDFLIGSSDSLESLIMTWN